MLLNLKQHYCTQVSARKTYYGNGILMVDLVGFRGIREVYKPLSIGEKYPSADNPLPFVAHGRVLR